MMPEESIDWLTEIHLEIVGTPIITLPLFIGTI